MQALIPGHAYRERSLQGNVISVDTLNCFLWDCALAIFNDGCDIYWLPLDRCFGCGEDIFY